MSRESRESRKTGEADPALRVAHLLRIDGYLDMAMLGMWAATERGPSLLGMADASLRHPGPDERDEELLGLVRALFKEARGYRDAGDFPAMMCRMRVVEDLLALRIIEITGDAPGERGPDGS
ncbi:hypothetical protein [Rubrobacter aplysinae]|uniref:hypothetical protein n=1 Tax=Rubrobacter aplysinae TaxID=909625 RepID=UPI00064BBA4B|nr:hypothetical protein [Rubrobacter aplysinae]